ncbi:MAG: ABC transporter substrate-binding protein [Chloroflexota bacterium]
MLLSWKPAPLPFVLSLLLAACGGSAVVTPSPTTVASTAARPSAAGTKIAVSYSTVTPDDLPVWLAQDAGIFKSNGLDVDLQFIASNTGVAALISSQTQAAAVGGSEVLAAVLGGADLSVLATVSPVFPYKFTVASSIKTVDDLRGKTIGIAQVGSSSDIGTRLALAKIGLVPGKDVSVIQVGSGPNRTAALQAGSIQASVTQPPDTTILERQGFHTLFDLATLGLPTANTVIAANRSWASGHKDLTQKMVDSVVASIARMKRDKNLATAILSKYYKSTDTEAMALAYDYYSGQVIQSVPSPKPEQFQGALEQLAKEKSQPGGFNISSMLDSSYVDNAVSRGLDR